MGRAGILYSDVAKAATKLLEDGKNPTVDNVREALGGTGSKSTIAPFLKRWKTEQQGAIAEAESGLPASLLAAVKGLHQHMQAEFSQQIEQIKQAHAEALRAASEREKQLRETLQTASAAKDALTEEFKRTREALSALQSDHHAQSVTLATVHAENTGLQQRFADRTAEVATLDHQLSQARAQFEHYQEAIVTQRAEERRTYEHRIARLEQELADVNRHINAKQEVLAQKEAHIALLTDERGRQENILHVAQEELTAIRATHERLSGRMEDATTAKEDMTRQLAALQQQLTDTRMTLAAQERTANMLTEQLNRAEESVRQLTEEKLAWLQERGALEHRVLVAEQKHTT